MNVKPAINFLTRDGQAPFTEKVTTILEWMKSNPAFPAPTPTLAVVEAAFEDYKVTTAYAAQGGTQNIAVRNARRAELVALLRPLASYVNGAANGNMEKLLSSGFPVQKPVRTPVGPLPPPVAPIVRQGAVTGSIAAAAPPVHGTSSYNWSVALKSTPDADVQTAQTTGARADFRGLTPGQTYLVCLNAVGSAGTSDWSDTGSLMVT